MSDEIRLSIQQASHRLGVSVDTIRRRLKSQSLKGQRDNAGQWWVMLPSDTPEAPTQATPGARVSTPIQIGAVELLLAQAERDRAEIQRLHALLTEERAERARLLDMMAAGRDAGIAERERMMSLVAEAVEAAGKAQAEVEAVRAERDAAKATLAELKLLTSALVDRVAADAKAEAAAARAEVAELRSSTGKALIGLQRVLREG